MYNTENMENVESIDCMEYVEYIDYTDYVNYTGTENVENDDTCVENTENVYLQNENTEPIHYFILFDEALLKLYGICPYTNDEKTYSWLKNQNDEGEAYYFLKKKIIDGCDIIKAKSEKEALEKWFESYFAVKFTPEQRELFDNTVLYFLKSKDAPCKTKLAKAKHNIILNNLFKLDNEVQIPVHKFINVKFNLNLVHPVAQEQKHELKDYYTKVSEYKSCITRLKQSVKFQDNKMKYLTQVYYEYGIDNSIFKQYSINIKQVGKYKNSKWSKMTKEERIDRFNSYLQSKLHWKSEHDISVFSDALDDLYTSKQIRYTNIKWDSKMGIIQNINGIEFQDDTIVSTVQKLGTVSKPCLNEKYVFDNIGIINEQILYRLLLDINVDVNDIYYDICKELKIDKIPRACKKVIISTCTAFKDTINTNEFTDTLTY
jgi:hypothetical protein